MPTLESLLAAVPVESGAGHEDHTRAVITEVIARLAAVEAAAGTHLVDLGTVEVTDLLAGPVTLYEVGEGFVLSIHYTDDFTPTNAGYFYVYGAGSGASGSYVQIDTEEPITFQSNMLGGNVMAALALSGSSGAGPWDNETAYAANANVIEAGFLWYTDGGTSGASRPDFEGAVEIGTVSDNGMTWTQDYAVPTTGSVHVYALVMEAVVP